ncbi:hypothetical protein HBB16_04295 [Pseudonocardia sp. MCCB 268]|nr:hypothetical protein [Pseudonocardia cytotoxica]
MPAKVASTMVRSGPGRRDCRERCGGRDQDWGDELSADVSAGRLTGDARSGGATGFRDPYSSGGHRPRPPASPARHTELRSTASAPQPRGRAPAGSHEESGGTGHLTRRTHLLLDGAIPAPARPKPSPGSGPRRAARRLAADRRQELQAVASFVSGCIRVAQRPAEPGGFSQCCTLVGRRGSGELLGGATASTTMELGTPLGNARVVSQMTTIRA